MHLSMLSPRMGAAGYPREIDSASFSLGGDFDIQVLPWGQEFNIAMTCFGQKVVPRGGNLTFSWCPGVGKLTLALVKMSNSPGSARRPPPLPWGFTLIGAELPACWPCTCQFTTKNYWAMEQRIKVRWLNGWCRMFLVAKLS